MFSLNSTKWPGVHCGERKSVRAICPLPLNLHGDTKPKHCSTLCSIWVTKATQFVTFCAAFDWLRVPIQIIILNSCVWSITSLAIKGEQHQQLRQQQQQQQHLFSRQYHLSANYNSKKLNKTAEYFHFRVCSIDPIPSIPE